MNHMTDNEAVDTFRQTVARIVRRLLEEKQEEQQQQRQQEEAIPCHSSA